MAQEENLLDTGMEMTVLPRASWLFSGSRMLSRGRRFAALLSIHLELNIFACRVHAVSDIVLAVCD
jgi:hypothetical protein